MNVSSLTFALLAGALCLASNGCRNAPGKPIPGDEATRPDQALDFPTLYKQNCAGCHGENGKNGAAVSLANPVYLATAGIDTIQRVTATGVPGTLMPAFGKRAGGTLTDAQVTVLAQGILRTWGRPDALGGATAIPYTSQSKGDPAQGARAFATFCASCHGSDGAGKASGEGRSDSIIDPTYLALLSDQSLRSTIIAGQPERGMPDWRSDLTGANSRPMTEQEVTDIVAWMASHRTSSPGQPYPQHP
ncbi:MAG: cytochrome c [Acidobacteriaceae bacterium]